MSGNEWCVMKIGWCAVDLIVIPVHSQSGICCSHYVMLLPAITQRRTLQLLCLFIVSDAILRHYELWIDDSDSFALLMLSCASSPRHTHLPCTHCIWAVRPSWYPPVNPQQALLQRLLCNSAILPSKCSFNSFIRPFHSIPLRLPFLVPTNTPNHFLGSTWANRTIYCANITNHHAIEIFQWRYCDFQR